MFFIASPARINRRKLSVRKSFFVGLILIAAEAIALITGGCAHQPPKRSEAVVDKIQWISDLDAGLALSKKENKPVMIDFVADWCAPCKEMDKLTFGDEKVIRKAQSFIPIRINIDNQKEVAAKYNGLARAYGGDGIPNILFLSGDGTKLKQFIGFKTTQQLIEAMNFVLNLHNERARR
jgi:thiol:disulfide interchange protein